MTVATRPLSLTVNGRKIGPMAVPEELMMLDFLNEHLGLTGSRLGCGQGVCRACTVILDYPDGHSEEIQTCITGAHDFAGKSIRTIEGHAERDGDGNVVRLSPVQQAFVEHFAFQCGYCTPGFVNAATVLMENLKRSPVARKDLEKKIEEALNSHICRCTGYVRYYQAMRDLILKSPGLVQG
jgi:aerobic-type carbon monoxide dehydrogenase small subunit (CoxS/CutS family)